MSSVSPSAALSRSPHSLTFTRMVSESLFLAYSSLRRAMSLR